MDTSALASDGLGVKPGAAVIASVAGYEFYAITLGCWPTLTALVRRLPPPARAGVCAAASGWLFAHMLIEAEVV